MKKFLIPVDFSFYSKKSIDFAVKLSETIPSELILMHVVDIPSGAHPHAADFIDIEPNAGFKQNEDKLELIRRSIIETTPNIVVKTILNFGNVNQTILSTAESEKADFIIMSTIGDSGIKEKILGSKTAYIIGKSTIPVIAIPWDYEWQPLDQLLLATNKYEKPGMALNTFFEIAGLLMSSVHAVTFTDDDNADAIQYLEAERGIKQFEKVLVKNYKEANLTTAHLVGKNFEESIQQYIRENHIGMLAMITYQKGFWDRLFNPSYTKRMSYHSNIPLLAIPAEQK